MPSSPVLVEHVLLIGMMGAGKSTVGRTVAERLGWRYLDSDEQVQANTGMTVPEIFAASGEAAFRREESAALAEAMTSEHPVVVSVAGGAVLDPENRRQIHDAGLVIWLRADVPALAARVGSGEGRPLLGDDPGAALARLSKERAPLYQELADVIIDTDTQTLEETVTEVLRMISSPDRAPLSDRWGASSPKRGPNPAGAVP